MPEGKVSCKTLQCALSNTEDSVSAKRQGKTKQRLLNLPYIHDMTKWDIGIIYPIQRTEPLSSSDKIIDGPNDTASMSTVFYSYLKGQDMETYETSSLHSKPHNTLSSPSRILSTS